MWTWKATAVSSLSSCTVGLTVGRLWVCAVIWYYKLRALSRMTSLLYYLPLLIFCQNSWLSLCKICIDTDIHKRLCTYMLSHVSTNSCAGLQIFRHCTTQQMVERLHAFGFTLKSTRDINKTEFIQQNKQNLINNINSTKYTERATHLTEDALKYIQSSTIFFFKTSRCV